MVNGPIMGTVLISPNPPEHFYFPVFKTPELSIRDEPIIYEPAKRLVYKRIPFTNDYYHYT
jgi:hypothetical protein